MTEPRIVDAEVVEVPKPERPELWIPVWLSEKFWRCTDPTEDRKISERVFNTDRGDADILVRIPGSNTPAREPEADAVEVDSAIDLLNIAAKHCLNDDMNATQFCINEAMERLAKIRGGR